MKSIFLVLSLIFCFSVPVSAETFDNDAIFTRFGTYFEIPLFEFLCDGVNDFFTARNIDIFVSKSEFIGLGLNYLNLSQDNATKEKEYLSKTYDYIYVPSSPTEEVKAEVVIEKEEKVVDTYINQKVLDEKASRKGMVGRWSIPAVNVDVAVFNSSSQQTADNKDSAVYFQFGDFMVLGDHVNQGFDRIKKCKEGTKAYLDTGNEIKEYVCTKYFTGHNQVDDMTDDNYKSVKYGANTGGITCYTCNGNWKNIWIVFFQPTN